MGNPFGSGTPTKLDIYRFGPNELLDVDRWATAGTNNTASVQVDSSYGVNLRTVLGGADNDEGSHTLDLTTIWHPAAGDKFKAVALVKLTEGNTDDMEFDFGFADVTADLASDTPSSHTNTTDHLTIGKVAGSLFWRGFFGNDATQVTSGASSYAATSGLWYRLEIIGEVQTDGLHCRMYATDMSGAVAGRNLIYTIGYGSSVAAQSVSGFTGMYFGVWVKASSANAEQYDFKPLQLELEMSGT